jgi:hypothetical protein
LKDDGVAGNWAGHRAEGLTAGDDVNQVFGIEADQAVQP